MSSRLKAFLAHLPRLVLPKEPLDQFTLFPKLPLEIQNKIWKTVAFETRAVPLAYNFSQSHTPVLYDQPNIPPILLVSKHVRKEGLRSYQAFPQISPCFRCCYGKMTRSRTVYSNTVVDQFIMVSPNNLFNALDFNIHLTLLDQIQILTIDHKGYLPTGLGSGSNAPDHVGLLGCLHRLKQLNIVVRNWCAQVGVNQSIGQELWREELRKNFQAHFFLAFKDARLKTPAKLEIRFVDWNDSDTAACSADINRERGWRYFDSVGNRYGW